MTCHSLPFSCSCHLIVSSSHCRTVLQVSPSMSEDIAAKLDRLTSSWSSVGGTCGRNTKELGEFLPQVRKGGDVDVVILFEGVCACVSTVLRFAAVFVQTCVWYGVRLNRGGEGSLPLPILSLPSLPFSFPSSCLFFTSPSLFHPIPLLCSSSLYLPPLLPSSPLLLPSLPLFSPLPSPSLSPPFSFPYHPRCSTFPCTSLPPSPVTFLQMEAQWELVKSFEVFLSEVEKSLEDLLPVEADLPKLERQRTTIEVRAVCDGREKEV